MKILKAIVKTIEQKIKKKSFHGSGLQISRGEDLDHKDTTQAYSHDVGKRKT